VSNLLFYDTVHTHVTYLISRDGEGELEWIVESGLRYYSQMLSDFLEDNSNVFMDSDDDLAGDSNESSNETENNNNEDEDTEEVCEDETDDNIVQKKNNGEEWDDVFEFYYSADEEEQAEKQKEKVRKEKEKVRKEKEKEKRQKKTTAKPAPIKKSTTNRQEYTTQSPHKKQPLTISTATKRTTRATTSANTPAKRRKTLK